MASSIVVKGVFKGRSPPLNLLSKTNICNKSKICLNPLTAEFFSSLVDADAEFIFTSLPAASELIFKTLWLQNFLRELIFLDDQC